MAISTEQQTTAVAEAESIGYRVAAATDLTPLERQAERLQERMERRFGAVTTQLEAVRALHARQALLQRTIEITFDPDQKEAPEARHLQVWPLTLQAHADWVRFSVNGNAPHFGLDTQAIAMSLAFDPPVESYPAVDAGVVSPGEDGSVVQVASSGFAHPGFSFDAFDAAQRIADAYAGTETTATVAATYTTPSAYVITGEGTARELTLLSTGRSDFEGSPLGREKNIERALQKEVTDLIVPPGAEFSFNGVIKGALDKGGWHMALAIFEGGRLEYVPGGGICQAATTVYRAALLAGLPIIKQRNHSLYVTYYAKHGVGIDATVYPGSQDMVFVNDTDDYLFIQSTTDGTEAIVHFYGVPDGRTVELSGPYFSDTAPEGMKNEKKDKPLARNEIAWKRTITKADGTAIDEVMVSTYKALPKTLHAEEEATAVAYTIER